MAEYFQFASKPGEIPFHDRFIQLHETAAAGGFRFPARLEKAHGGARFAALESGISEEGHTGNTDDLNSLRQVVQTPLDQTLAPPLIRSALPRFELSRRFMTVELRGNLAQVAPAHNGVAGVITDLQAYDEVGRELIQSPVRSPDIQPVAILDEGLERLEKGRMGRRQLGGDASSRLRNRHEALANRLRQRA